jgi:ATP-dependent RNA helicase DeaD
MFLIGTTSMYGREYPQNSSTSTILPSVKGISPFFQGVFTTLSLFSPTEKHDIVLVPEKGLHRFFLFVPQIVSFLASQTQKTVLILTPGTEEVQEIEDFIRLVHPSSLTKKDIKVLGLGTTPDIRKEEEKLSSMLGGVLISTAERLIDHIRRGTFPIDRINRLVIDCSTQSILDGFIQDTEFFFSRRSSRLPTILVSQTPRDVLNPLVRLLKKPIWIPEIEGFPCSYIEHATGVSRVDALLQLLQREKTFANETIVLVPEREEVIRLQDILFKQFPNLRSIQILHAGAVSPVQWKRIRAFIFSYLPSPEELILTCKILHTLDHRTSLFILENEQEQEALTKLQEITKVSMKQSKLNPDEKALKKLIGHLMEEIRTFEDPKELAFYRKFISKHISIFLRSYFSAYLLKLLYQSYTGNGVSLLKNSVKTPMTTLFFSMGKNRKIFPRDWSSLICSLPGFDKSDIGEIKILDNYSFVEISSEKVQRLIEQLNGTDFKGKKLTVNFARKKEEALKGELSANNQG